MRKVTVPVDTSSEQKTILGILSVRQLAYIGGCGALYYNLFPLIWKLGGHWMVSIIVSIFGLIPFLAFVGVFGFYKVSKYNMFFDKYLVVKLTKKSQIGLWRKGH